MTVPLMILAFFSIFGGWCAAPKLIGGIDYFEKFLRPVFSSQVAPNTLTEEPAASPAIGLLHAVAGWPVIVAVLGLLLAWWLYIKNPTAPERLAQSLRGLYLLVFNKYYVDEIYAALIVRPLIWVSKNVLWHGVDEGLIDGIVHGSAHVARASGGRLRELQSGNTRSYASWVLVGVLGFTALLLVLFTRGVR
jgi:NADH-quinone oxidoreductase subunit L